ncbi:MAG: M48 family metallopeptidase [Planctomycetota bacterium]|jgi:heat shock protein HtpX
MPQTFQDLIAQNKRTSVMLVAVFVLFIAAMAITLALAVLVMMDPERAAAIQIKRGLAVGAVAAAISFGISLLSYFSGDQLILGVQGAHELKKADDPQLFNVVEEMAIAGGLPMPKIYLIDDPSPNAFATGRDPEHASVAITTGLRTKLNREELQGVMAHEMSHIRNYDIRLMLLLAVLIGTVTMLSDFFWSVLRFGPRGGSSSNNSSSSDGDKKGGAQLLMIVVLVLAVLFSILAPLLASMLQFAVSRQREYLADATGVELTRNPVGLAHALEKLNADPTPMHILNRGTAHLFIVNPIKKFANLGDTIFASHPPIETRIQRLYSLIQPTK